MCSGRRRLHTGSGPSVLDGVHGRTADGGSEGLRCSDTLPQSGEVSRHTPAALIHTHLLTPEQCKVAVMCVTGLCQWKEKICVSMRWEETSVSISRINSISDKLNLKTLKRSAWKCVWRVCVCVCLEERCLDEETYIKALLELNPSAEWVIKSVQHWPAATRANRPSRHVPYGPRGTGFRAWHEQSGYISTLHPVTESWTITSTDVVFIGRSSGRCTYIICTRSQNVVRFITFQGLFD